MNTDSKIPFRPNPKDYESTIEEGEDEEFIANDNFRETNMNNAFSLSDCFKDTHGDEEFNPPSEESERTGHDGEGFGLSQGYKSVDDSCEMFSSSEDGIENFPCNDADEFLNYIENEIGRAHV